MKIREILPSVGVLFTGTIASQAIYLGGSLLITRLFQPADYGLFAQMMAVILPLTIVATLRLEFAISLPKDEMDSYAICTLAMLIGLLFSLAVGLSSSILIYLEILPAIPYTLVFMAACSIWLACLYSILNYWMIFRAKFATVAVAKPGQAAGITFAQVALGFSGAASSGLLAGQVLGQLVGVLLLFWKFLADPVVKGMRGLIVAAKSNLRLAPALIKKYRKFPLVSTPAGLMNVLSNNLPVLLLGLYHGALVAGLFALMQRVVAGPLALLSSPFLDVFKEQASREMRENGNFRASYQTTILLLSLIGVVPCGIVYFLGEWLFAIFFGEEWSVAGVYASSLAVMLYLRFVASPLSYSFVIAERQDQDFWWQAVLLLSTILVFFWGKDTLSPVQVISFYGLIYSLMYCFNLVLTYKAAGGREGVTS